MIKIRPVEIDDIEDIKELWIKWSQLMGIQDNSIKFSKKAGDMYRDYILQSIGKENQGFFCAETEDGQIVGFVEGSIRESHPMFHKEKYAYIYNLYVRKSFRNKKIGKKLYEAFENWAKNRNVNRIELSVRAQNHLGRGFWYKLGYNDHAILMEKEIEENTKKADEKEDIKLV